MGYNLQSRGEVLSQLGRFDEAKALLDQAAAIANKPGGELQRLSAETQLGRAQIALMQGDFATARATAEKTAEAAGAEFKSVAIGAKIVLGLAETYNGAKTAGTQVTSEAVNLARQLNDPAQLATAHLALATAMLVEGDSKGASSYALQAQEVFARLGRPASEWRALLIAAQARQNLGDKNEAREYARRSSSLWAELEKRWGSENYNSYLSRPDIQRFRKQLEQLTGGV